MRPKHLILYGCTIAIGVGLVTIVPIVLYKSRVHIVADDPPSTFVNSIGMKFVFLPTGHFYIGSSESAEVLARAYGLAPAFFTAELPRRGVEVFANFYLSAHEVTVEDFERFVLATQYQTEAEVNSRGGSGFNTVRRQFETGPQYTWRSPGWNQSPRDPVVNVSWNDARHFCDWLSKVENKPYRLPTEIQWEYACRGGSLTRFWSGNEDSDLKGVANLADESLRATCRDNIEVVPWNDGYPFTAPVGSFRASPLGLYDMHGNVWEWCEDPLTHDYSQSRTKQSPKQAATVRVIRGGGFYQMPVHVRSTHRSGSTANFRNCITGFRVVMNADLDNDN